MGNYRKAIRAYKDSSDSKLSVKHCSWGIPGDHFRKTELILGFILYL